jgi:hypothetical protein
MISSQTLTHFNNTQYYLILTLSQFVPVLRVGPIFTYAAPLAFVVGLSIFMEAYLDIRRMLRDREFNEEKYQRLTKNGLKPIKACDIRVGHFIKIDTNRRVGFFNGFSHEDHLWEAQLSNIRLIKLDLFQLVLVMAIVIVIVIMVWCRFLQIC